jgi:hypothetical protein
MLFYIKARIDVSKMAEFGQKLFSGELERSQTVSSYCLKDDPEVGINIWETENKEELDKLLSQYRPYFSDVIEVKEVIKPMDAFVVLQKKLSGIK